jgi:hypothetical protein
VSPTIFPVPQSLRNKARARRVLKHDTPRREVSWMMKKTVTVLAVASVLGLGTAGAALAQKSFLLDSTGGKTQKGRRELRELNDGLLHVRSATNPPMPRLHRQSPQHFTSIVSMASCPRS